MRGLYLITNDDPFQLLLEKLQVALATGQIAILQYRRKKVAKADLSETEIYHFAAETVVTINKMKPQFEDLDSALDDTAADYIAEAMMMVVQDKGYIEIELEELVSNREW